MYAQSDHDERSRCPGNVQAWFVRNHTAEALNQFAMEPHQGAPSRLPLTPPLIANRGARKVAPGSPCGLAYSALGGVTAYG